MSYDVNNYYYLVHGWYESTSGLHQNSFYGAVAKPSNYLNPERCVLHGKDAQKASESAAVQGCCVYPEEILESHDRENPPDQPDYLDKQTDLTPKEQERTEHMLLDKDDEEDEDNPAEDWIADLKKEVVSELVGTGAIAMGPLDSILSDPSTNKSRLGLGDRGGHGTEKNLGPKKLKPGKNFAKGHSSTLKGFGTSHRSNTASSSAGTGSSGSLPTISQASTGRRGGRG